MTVIPIFVSLDVILLVAAIVVIVIAIVAVVVVTVVAFVLVVAIVVAAAAAGPIAAVAIPVLQWWTCCHLIRHCHAHLEGLVRLRLHTGRHLILLLLCCQ